VASNEEEGLRSEGIIDAAWSIEFLTPQSSSLFAGSPAFPERSRSRATDSLNLRMARMTRMTPGSGAFGSFTLSVALARLNFRMASKPVLP
jgi:hypothetical protein